MFIFTNWLRQYWPAFFIVKLFLFVIIFWGWIIYYYDDCQMVILKILSFFLHLLVAHPTIRKIIFFIQFTESIYITMDSWSPVLFSGLEHVPILLYFDANYSRFAQWVQLPAGFSFLLSWPIILWAPVSLSGTRCPGLTFSVSCSTEKPRCEC